ncbi:hypothetical protein [Aeromonas caviae]|uniref:hypothetical protein n=1 Tax=Aeromonas caviae TaxID=648 RepID=UPI0011AE4019|nr:hypothetical protein [Aeromonas caviae]MBS4637185.1 hypothetical protein [Aeromonas caviae]WQD91095.1 hypothetical protein U0022_10500 [Aeromonas caviae]
MGLPIKWFTVKVIHTDRVPFELFGELEKGSLYISAGGRFCGPGAAAYIQNESLAAAYVKALALRRKKTDPHFDARVCGVESSNEHFRDFIARDSQKINDKLARWGIKV